ncbi:drug/metabolite exporter YedA [Deinococcus roseus]|uniref:Drug/metabolite exporter YedA n=1 Tax=Deinococcus roseus TaxID=392414 RepID=A0ABQ2CZB9_9DEIO|nr:drug/metabolite exporter YedA [Deinococcus roseus]GGJ34183.1 drug/metabolite exporter YedA [Deinococcus roseus]
MTPTVLWSLISLYLIWGSTYFGMRVALTGFPPFLQGGLRYMTAGLLLLLFLKLRKTPWPSGKQVLNAVMVGVLLTVVGHGMVLYAEQDVSSAVAAVAVGVSPVWAAIWSALWGKAPKGTEWVGLILGVVGIVVLNSGKELTAAPIAMVALIVAPMSWSFGTVWSKHLSMPEGVMNTALQIFFGGIGSALVGLLLGEKITHVPGPAWVAFWYLVVFGSIIAYNAFMYLVRNVSTPLAMSYAYVNPIVALFVGHFLGGETINLQSILACVLILFAVVLLTRPSREQAPAQTQKSDVPSD